MSAQLRFVSHGYAAVLGIPIVAGREFTDRDLPDAEPVMLVNETFVRTYLSDRDPLGAILQLGWGGAAPRRIVGVVGDVRHRDLADTPRPEMYVPQAQFANRQMTMVVRASNDDTAAAIAPRLRDTIRSVTPAIAVPAVMPLEAYRQQTLAVPRFTATLLGLFGTAALLLTLVGLSGTTAFTAAQRRREIGIRLALGADAGALERLIVRQSLAPVVAGVAAGLLIAAAAGRVLSTWLYDVGPTDPATMAAVSAVVIVTAAAACAVPARRATRLALVASIRQDA
jgi:putative ABC transport system permease protein